MPELIDSTAGPDESSGRGTDEAPEVAGRAGPSNAVHARVGDAVLRAAREGVRRGMRPEDIIRELITEYDVRLNLGELRLLLASRPMQQPDPSG